MANQTQRGALFGQGRSGVTECRNTYRTGQRPNNEMKEEEDQLEHDNFNLKNV